MGDIWDMLVHIYRNKSILSGSILERVDILIEDKLVGDRLVVNTLGENMLERDMRVGSSSVVDMRVWSSSDVGMQARTSLVAESMGVDRRHLSVRLLDSGWQCQARWF